MKIFSCGNPWYAAGLAFKCTGCGACCSGPGEGYVWVTNEEIEAIAENLGMAEDDLRRKYVRRIGRRFSLVERDDNKDCIFLESDGQGGRRCRVYPVRPSQCRTWPFWGGNLRRPDDWAMAGTRCPGINRGGLRDCDDIEASREATPS